MKKQIIIKEEDGHHSIEVTGYTSFELLGILRYHEKDIWLQITKQTEQYRKKKHEELNAKK